MKWLKCMDMIRSFKCSSIHFSSVSKTKKEKEDLRNQARSYLSSCTQYGGTSHEITFLAAYLQFKSNDWTKALGTVASLPEVGVNNRVYILAC